MQDCLVEFELCNVHQDDCKQIRPAIFKRPNGILIESNTITPPSGYSEYSSLRFVKMDLSDTKRWCLPRT